MTWRTYDDGSPADAAGSANGIAAPLTVGAGAANAGTEASGAPIGAAIGALGASGGSCSSSSAARLAIVG